MNDHIISRYSPCKMNPDQTDYKSQQTLVAALLGKPCFPHAAQNVRLVETHISWVLLAGHYAYKIKKAINLGFLDFTQLEARRFYCSEEIRLNRRLAPHIYLDVIPIGGEPDSPHCGALPAIEYAVRMRRFEISKQLDHLLARGKILPQHMDNLAASLAVFHGSLPPAKVTSAFGTPEAILSASMQNFEQLQPLLTAQPDCEAIENIRRATRNAYSANETYFNRRHAHGYVRECHGDLHLSNIVLIGNQPVPFDGIEFSPALRWIDVMDEVAFLVMDLLHGKRPDLAFRFLNAYLEATGDYPGVAVLRFYLTYRAVVRAKVCAIRSFQAIPEGTTDKPVSHSIRLSKNASQVAGYQPDHSPLAQTQELTNCRNYLALAEECLARRRPALIITHGLPGSGKSTFAQAALERLQAIRLRSDVERKRLFGIKPLEDSHSRMGADIYSIDATQRTYARLLELAHGLLDAGFPVIVDAAFLNQEEREQFHALALSQSVPFVIVSMKASTATLSARIMLRRSAENDASEADLDVLQMLQAVQQPLLPHELARTVEFINDEHKEIHVDTASWNRLDKLLIGS